MQNETVKGRSNNTYVGADAERTISQYNANIAFCRSMSLDGRLTDNSIEENNVRRSMMRNSARNIFLCDESKFGKTSIHNLCMVTDVDEIVSNAPLPPGIQEIFRGR